MSATKSRRGLLVIFAIAALAVLGYSFYGSRPLSEEDLQLQQPEAKPQTLNMSRRLRDGSFNPIPPEKRAIDSDPSELLADDWRTRYATALAEATNETAPTIYVYPFLDSTRQGVGLTQTYGWHLAGSAALALRTDARFAPYHRPLDYGMTLIRENGEFEPATWAEWTERAIKDPATQDVDLVIVGRFRQERDSSDIVMRISLIEKLEDGATRESHLLEDSISAEHARSFLRLSDMQRRTFGSLAARLVEVTDVQARVGTSPVDLDVEVELDGVAALLDGNDGWLMMDGIDRALALATLFPDDSLPMQAAAYGLTTISWTLFRYALENDEVLDLGLRAHALSQVALSMIPEGSRTPTLPVLTSVMGCYSLAHPMGTRLDNSLRHHGATPPALELRGYYESINFSVNTKLGEAVEQQGPDWWVLRAEKDATWFIGRSRYRGFIEERTPFWDLKDVYTNAFLQQHKNAGHYFKDRVNNFDLYHSAAHVGTQMALAAELATLLVSIEADGEREKLARQAATILKIQPAYLLAPSSNGDYFATRRVALQALTGWRVPMSPSDPSAQMMGLLASTSREALEGGARRDALGGLGPFEYTAAQRVRHSVRRESMGSMIMTWFYAWPFSDYDGIVAAAGTYLGIRPESSEAQSQLAEYIGDRFASKKGAREWIQRSRRKAYELLPIHAEYMLEAGKVYIDAGDVAKALPSMREMIRMDPFVPLSYLDLGNIARSLGRHASAVEYYSVFLPYYPDRHDIHIKWAWTMCQLGKMDDPRIEPIFTRARKALPGNPTFWTGELAYLRGWKKDYDAARDVARRFREVHGVEKAVYLARVEFESDNEEAGIAALTDQDFSEFKGLGLADVHASFARLLIEFGHLDLARPHVDQAAGIDSWKADVILAIAELEAADGNYESALAHFDRYEDRYYSGNWSRLAKVDCLINLKREEEARELLEEWALNDVRAKSNPYMMPKLMRIYVDDGNAEGARDLIDRLLIAQARRRGVISDVLKVYKELDEEHGEELWARIDDIMAGEPL